jgi:hypothetical protein
MIPGDCAFPINPNFLDIDVQVDRFLHSGPTDFDGLIIAIDYELYEPNAHATISPGALKEYLRELRKHIGQRHILMYAGKAFWEEPPHSGQLSDYGEHMHMWNPWYWSMDIREHPGNTTRTPAGIPDGGDATRGCRQCVLNSASAEQQGFRWT